MSLAISDWVQGKTKEGEFIHGYVTSLNEEKNYASVYVVQSDHDLVVGTTIVVLTSWLKQQPALAVQDNEAAILEFIELALSTWDTEWFTELTEQLHALGNKRQVNQDGGAPLLNYRNRLGQLY